MTEDILKDIRKRCRMAMNGIASASMRERGLSYKVNFGLSIQQIKELSKRYEPNATLAGMLWAENTRELKILATLLYPVNDFTREMADSWAKEIPNQEIREQVCINLFQNLPFASESGLKWANSADTDIHITGYWLLARLFIAKHNEVVATHQLSFIWQDIISEDTFLRNAAQLLLKHIGRQSKEQADAILEKLSVYKDESDLLKQEAFNSVAFEFNYFWE